MKPTIEDFRARLDRVPTPPHYWVAFSGGLDSHVLLHLCARLETSIERPRVFAAVHIHHGLHRDADDWSRHCQAICKELNIPFTLIKVDATAKVGDSPEEVARKARYQALASTMAAGEVVLTAQHRDDQAETVLLQLLRGAGPAGLAAMPEYAPFGPGLLLRPLLAYSRAELRSYAQEHGLRWLDDPSNLDLAYDRNFVRHRVLPRIKERWPGASKTLSRTARHCAEAQQLLGDLAMDLYRSVRGPDLCSLSVKRLGTLRAAHQRLVLRTWLQGAGYRLPSAAVIARIQTEVLAAGPAKTPIVAWREGQVRRYRDGLFLLPPASRFDPTVRLSWDGSSRLLLPDDNGALQSATTEGLGIDAQIWRRSAISVRYRRGGETCRLPGRAGRHTLKKLFQESGIPPWLRERAPLVYLDDELAAIAGWWICEPFVGRGEEPRMAVVWLKSDDQPVTPPPGCAPGL